MMTVITFGRYRSGDRPENGGENVRGTLHCPAPISLGLALSGTDIHIPVRVATVVQG